MKDGRGDVIATTNIYRIFPLCQILFRHLKLEIDNIFIINMVIHR